MKNQSAFTQYKPEFWTFFKMDSPFYLVKEEWALVYTLYMGNDLLAYAEYMRNEL